MTSVQDRLIEIKARLTDAISQDAVISKILSITREDENKDPKILYSFIPVNNLPYASVIYLYLGTNIYGGHSYCLTTGSLGCANDRDLSQLYKAILPDDRLEDPYTNNREPSTLRVIRNFLSIEIALHGDTKYILTKSYRKI